MSKKRIDDSLPKTRWYQTGGHTGIVSARLDIDVEDVIEALPAQGHDRPTFGRRLVLQCRGRTCVND